MRHARKYTKARKFVNAARKTTKANIHQQMTKPNDWKL